MQPFAFFSPCTVYYCAKQIAWVSLFINQKKEVNLTLLFFLSPHCNNPPPIHFSYAKERMINEFCLYDAAEIHLLVSNLFICLFILISDTLTDFACFHVCAHLDHMKNVLFPLALNAHSSIYLPCRCMSCVASMWGCQWNTIEHTCSDMDDAVDAHIIKNRQVCLFLHPIHTFQYF